MNLEDIRLKSITPPPGDKVSQWHVASFGFDRREAPLPPIPPSPSESRTPNPTFVLHPASESVNQHSRHVFLPSAPATATENTQPLPQHSSPLQFQDTHQDTNPIPPENNPQEPPLESPDASSMGTERPESALERAKDLDDDDDDHVDYTGHHHDQHHNQTIDNHTDTQKPHSDDIPLIPSSPSTSTNKLQRNFTINDNDLKQLLSAATDQRQDKTVRDALKRAARERIDVISQIEHQRQQEAAKAEEENIPPWALSIYELLHQTHHKLETLNIRSPEASRVGSPVAVAAAATAPAPVASPAPSQSPSPSPNPAPLSMEAIHAQSHPQSFPGEYIPHSTPPILTSHPMQHSNHPIILPVGEYEPHSAPYPEPYPIMSPSSHTKSKKAPSTVALPPSAPVERPPTEPALPAASPPGDNHNENPQYAPESRPLHNQFEYIQHPTNYEIPDAPTPKPSHAQTPIREFVLEPSPPMPVAPQTTPALDYSSYKEESSLAMDESVTPNKVPIPDSSVAESVHHIHHLPQADGHFDSGTLEHVLEHSHAHDHDHEHVHSHSHTPTHLHTHPHAPTHIPANHPWENISDRLAAWADLWSAHATPNQLELAKESTHLTRYVSMIACDIFCTQVYKRWVRTISARYPPVQIDKLFLPPSFTEVLNSAVGGDAYAHTAPTFRSFWNDLGFTGTPKQLLTLALYRTDRYHFQVLRFDLEAGVLTHYDPFDAPALLDPRPRLWWTGLREVFPDAHIPPDHKLTERVVAINRPKPTERSDSPLAALASWRHMLVNKKPNKETDLLAVRSLIAAEIEGVQKVTDRRNRQKTKKILQTHN
ncbi:hypothetical protein E3P86_02153 [Wallemia ichthyophaga]|uniref:Uncharacterized protein n=1 Tax=Wallemia ichthyophaga TaxID=245174 RepID=A0A4V4M5I9_WALIC|nr:hypothetical protein E3P86_02153 [Wallemia ichthyophaga]